MIIELPPLPDCVAAGRRPNWDFDKIRHRSCPVCDEDIPNTIAKRPDKLDVHACSGYGMIYLANIPSEECLNEYYDNYCTFKNYIKKINNKFWVKLKIHAGLHFDPYLDILLNTGGVRGMSVCEIGSSFGSWLELIKICGGSPFAVEIDSNARKVLESKRIPNATELGQNLTFDIICLIQVLEHLSTPSATLGKISNALKPDGRLLISIPNTEEFARIGPSWVGFRADLEHLNFFTLQSLSIILLKHNLFIEHFWEHAQPELQRTIESIENFRKRPGVRNKIINLIRNLFSYNFFDQGTYVLTVLARKTHKKIII